MGCGMSSPTSTPRGRAGLTRVSVNSTNVPPRTQGTLGVRYDQHIRFSSGDEYNGALRDGLKSGHGEYSWANGAKYTGQWVADCMHGAGVFTWRDGRRYEGRFVADDMQGTGKYFFTDGSWFMGQFAHDQVVGVGVLFDEGGRRHDVRLDEPTDPQFVALLINVPGGRQQRTLLQRQPQRARAPPAAVMLREVNGERTPVPTAAPRERPGGRLAGRSSEGTANEPDVLAGLGEHESIVFLFEPEAATAAPTGSALAIARARREAHARAAGPRAAAAARPAVTAIPCPQAAAVSPLTAAVPGAVGGTSPPGDGGIRTLSGLARQATMCPMGEDPCVVCMTYRQSYVCVPCGHQCLCRVCAHDKRMTRCPMCRTEYVMTMKVFK